MSSMLQPQQGYFGRIRKSGWWSTTCVCNREWRRQACTHIMQPKLIPHVTLRSQATSWVQVEVSTSFLGSIDIRKEDVWSLKQRYWPWSLKFLLRGLILGSITFRHGDRPSKVSPGELASAKQRLSRRQTWARLVQHAHTIWTLSLLHIIQSIYYTPRQALSPLRCPSSLRLLISSSIAECPFGPRLHKAFNPDKMQRAAIDHQNTTQLNNISECRTYLVYDSFENTQIYQSIIPRWSVRWRSQ